VRHAPEGHPLLVMKSPPFESRRRLRYLDVRSAWTRFATLLTVPNSGNFIKAGRPDQYSTLARTRSVCVRKEDERVPLIFTRISPEGPTYSAAAGVVHVEPTSELVPGVRGP
jgi:hypothetical protein